MFGIISVLGLIAGGSPASVAHYFSGSMSCGLIFATIVTVVYGTIASYRDIVSYEHMIARRRRVRRMNA